MAGALGVQAPLLLASVPSGYTGALPGDLVLGKVLTNGTYRCLIPIAGLVSELQVHLRSTFADGSVTTDLDTLYYTANPTDVSTWVDKTAGSGTGATSTTVIQTSTLDTLAGETYAALDIVVAGSTLGATVTLAEYNGV